MFNRVTSFPAALALAALSLISTGPAQTAEVPARTESGQTLVVPPEQEKLGDIYYITTGDDSQITAVSDALLQRATITSTRVVGYLLTPFDIESAESPLLAAAFRVPAKSLRAGLDSFDEALRSSAILDADKYSELTYKMLRVSDVKLLNEEKGRRNYTLTLAGELTIKDKTIALEAPAQFAIVPFTWQTMGRAVGELATLRTTFELKLADIGVTQLPRPLTGRVADTVKVDIFLLGSTVTPDKNIDLTIKREHHLKQLQFLTRVRDFDDPEGGYEYGRTVAQEMWGDAQALNRLAYAALTESGIRTRDLAFVTRLATRANELTESKDPVILYTLARGEHDKGAQDAGLKWLRQAAALADKAPAEAAAEIRATLERWEKQAPQ